MSLGALKPLRRFELASAEPGLSLMLTTTANALDPAGYHRTNLMLPAMMSRCYCSA